MTVEKTNLPRMRTIREVARLGILSEHCLRQMQKRGQLPCMYAGTKCLINVDLLIAQLNSLGDGGSFGGEH